MQTGSFMQILLSILGLIASLAFVYTVTRIVKIRTEGLDLKLEAGPQVSINEDEIVREIRTQIEARASKELLEEIKAGIQASTPKNPALEELESTHYKAARRLTAYANGLANRNAINLALGCMFSLVALGTLFVFALELAKQHWALEDFLVQSVPRLALATFIQLFGYFFLRLYRSGLADLSVIYNEMTAIDFKFCSAHAAICLNDKSISSILTTFSKMERNFILNKDQTTIQLEREKIELSQERTITEELIHVIDKLARRN